MSKHQFADFADFYPYYLAEHANATCRQLHFVGTSLIILLWLWAISTQNWWWLLATPVIGYGFAWVGHFFFEHNKPATFDYPIYSLMGDWVMWKDMLLGRIDFGANRG